MGVFAGVGDGAAELTDRARPARPLSFVMAEFRGTFRHGVIVLNGEHAASRLREGDRVEISRVGSNAEKPVRKAKSTRGGKKLAEALESLFGSAKSRKEWKGKSSERIASDLRRSALGWDRKR